MVWRFMVTSSFERHLQNKVWFTYGACVRVVYSLNSLSCMVKYGLKSLQYFNGEIQLQSRKIKSFCIYTMESFTKEKSNLKFIRFAIFRYTQVALSCHWQWLTWSFVWQLHYIYLTSASTVSEDSAGDGAMTTSGSPSSTSSQSIWMWKNTGQKHLK